MSRWNWALCLAVLLAGTLRADVHMRAGGDAFTDAAGVEWTSDSAIAVGGWSFDSTDEANGPLYQTCRWGTVAYHFEMTAGSYLLTLYFAEPTYTAAAQRVFSVEANGAILLKDFDIFAAAGKGKPLIKTFIVTAPSGVIDLLLIPGSANWPLLNGLEITAAPALAPGPTTLPFLLGPGLMSVQLVPATGAAAPPTVSIDCSVVACWDSNPPATWPPEFPCPGSTYFSKSSGYIYTCAIISTGLRWQRWALETTP